MASELKRYDAYIRWKSLGLKRGCTEEIAESFGISRQTLYKWHNKPIKVNDVIYENWEEAYKAETDSSRKNYEIEIENQLKDGWKLLDVIQHTMLMKMAVMVKDDAYKPTIDDIEKITKLSELIHSRVDDNTSNESNNNLNLRVSWEDDNG